MHVHSLWTTYDPNRLTARPSWLGSSLGRWLVLAIVVVWMAAPNRAEAANLVVTSLADNTTNGDGDCTLREAMTAAIQNTDYNDCTGVGAYGDDTITFAVSGTITLGSALPPIFVIPGAPAGTPGAPGALTIDGGGAVTISGDHRVPVFTVQAVLTVQNLTIAFAAEQNSLGGGAIINGGTLTITNCTLAGNSTQGSGGAISNGGTLTITDSTLTGNSASSGGGGIFNFQGTLTITDSTLTGNSASGGGAIFNGGILTITDSTIADNSASGGSGIFSGGGGISNFQGTLTVTNSTIADNSASGGGLLGGRGGGISSSASNVSITNSTLARNSVSTGGNFPSFGGGGGISSLSVSFPGFPGGFDGGGGLTITNSTIADNSVSFSGSGLIGGGGGILSMRISTSGFFGGVAPTITNSTVKGNSVSGGLGGGIFAGNATLTNTTLADNSATGSNFFRDLGIDPNFSGGGGIFIGGTVTLTNSIVANSPAGSNCGVALAFGAPPGPTSPAGTITDGGNNIDSDGTCSFDTGTIDPLLDPNGLQDNGGPTPTLALQSNSPAIDAIPQGTSGCGTTITTDQRGVARPYPAGGACDIGAFEVVNQPPVARCQNITVSADNGCHAAVTGQQVDNGSSDPDNDPLTFSLTPSGPFSLGTTPVTLTVTDSYHASSQCTATVTVVDTTPPSIICPANPVVSATSASGAAVTFAPTVADNCSVTAACTPPSGSTFAIGTTNVGCTATDGSGNSASCAFAVTVQTTDLAITNQAQPQLQIKIGGEANLTYTIGVKNSGPGVASGVVMTDPLPSGTLFVSASSSRGSCSTPAVGAGGAVSCQVGTLANGASATITIVVKVRQSLLTLKTITNTATVSAGTYDPNSANNAATAKTLVVTVLNL